MICSSIKLSIESNLYLFSFFFVAGKRYETNLIVCGQFLEKVMNKVLLKDDYRQWIVNQLPSTQAGGIHCGLTPCISCLIFQCVMRVIENIEVVSFLDIVSTIDGSQLNCYLCKRAHDPPIYGAGYANLSSLNVVL